MSDIMTFLMSLLENIVIIQIINSFFKPKNRIVECCFILFFSIFSFCINTMHHPLLLIIAVIILIIYTFYNNIGMPVQKALIAIAVFGLNVYLSFLIVTGLNNLDTSVTHLIEERLSFYICIVIISKFLLITIFSFIQSFLSKHLYRTNWKLTLSELCIFFISILISFYIYMESYINAFTTFVLLIIIACALLIFLYFYKSYQNSLRNKELKEIWEMERKDYINQTNQLYCFYDNSYTKSIELKKHFDQLRKSIESDDKAYSIETLNVIDNLLFTKISFGNEVLDLLLNGKLQIMQKYNISFQAAASTPLKNIYQDDITFIIGTLLDSAIEQVKNKDNACINLHISKISAGSKIIIEYTPERKFKEMNYILSKIDPLIKKYNGLSNYTKENDKAYYKIIFMQEENK